MQITARKSDLIDITIIVKHKTERAVLIDDGGIEPQWIPLSQCELSPDIGSNTHTLTLPEWLAQEKELI